MFLNWKQDIMGYTAQVRLTSPQHPDEPIWATCRVREGTIGIDVRSRLGQSEQEPGIADLLSFNVPGVLCTSREQMLRFESWVSERSEGGLDVYQEKL